MSALAPIFMEVVAISWRAAWLILLVVALRCFLRRQVAPAMMFAGWLVVAVVLLMPLRLPVPWDPLGLAGTAKVRPPARASAVVIQMEEEPARLMQSARSLQAIEPVDAEAAARIREEAVNFDVFDVSVSTTRNFVGDLALVWLMGMSALLSLRAVALLRLRRRLQVAKLPADEVLARAVQEACVELGIARVPAVVVTPMVGTPALCGIFRPQLLFPVGFADRLSAEDLRWVVRHELGHLQRRDLPAQALLQLACAVHWFNPLVWLAARLARHDCELACDDHVLRRARADDGADYGRTLLKVLGRTVGRNRLPAAVGIIEGRRQLFKRIAMIAGYRQGNLRPMLVGAALLAGFIFVGCTSLETPAAKPVEHPPSQAKAIPVSSDPATQAIQEARRAEAEAWADGLQFAVQAVGEVGGVPVALIDINGEPSIVMVRTMFSSYRVQSIDVARGEVVLTRQGHPARVLPVTNSRPVVFPTLSPMRIQSLLNSADYLRNDTLLQRMIPDAVIAAWGQISREARTEILLNYLESGYVMSYFFSRGGIGMHGSPRRLFEVGIQQQQQEQRDAFFNSLRPEQREAYAGGAQIAIRFTASKEEQEAQAASARALQARQAEVIANLTPAQRVLYEQWQSQQQRSAPAVVPIRP